MPGYEVKTKYVLRATNSDARETIVTPASGNRIRIISIMAAMDELEEIVVAFYFGTGAEITTTATKAIAYGRIGTGTLEPFTQSNFQVVFPPHFGPLGAKNDVVSANAATDFDHSVVIVYYEIGG